MAENINAVDKTEKTDEKTNENSSKKAKIAFVFPGQGAQYENMGKSFYDNYATAREIYAACLAEPTQFFGTIADFTATNIAQPAIFLTDIIAATLLEENGIIADGAAGFSLGELPTVAFGGLLPTKQAFELTQFRAEKMHAATTQQKGGMWAVLGLSADVVGQICTTVKNAYPVNYNAPGQVVVAFSQETDQEQLKQAIVAAKGKAVPLAVAGAFHSPLMDGVSAELATYLQQLDFSQPKIPVYANVTAKPYTAATAAELLTKQVNSPVLWQAAIEQMLADGFTTFVETGPGKTLAGLIKKIAKNNENVRIFNVHDQKTLEEVLSNVK
ncbi:MAG: ACP S-malonyltransferase [Defluviitaleaceae bacterium]|nr:ACP S-malonyltransferase [Defluviitaleaceae bacterium]